MWFSEKLTFLGLCVVLGKIDGKSKESNIKIELNYIYIIFYLLSQINFIYLN